MSDSLIQIRNLSVEFQTEDGSVKAVKNISFDIPRGKTVGLVGESGSGKSVTSLAIMRLIPNPPGKVTSGEILYEDQDLLKMSEAQMRKVRGDRISMIFQEPMTSLNPVFTVVWWPVAVSVVANESLAKRACASGPPSRKPRTPKQRRKRNERITPSYVS